MKELLKIVSFPIGTLGCNCSLIYSPHTREAIAIDPGNDANAFLNTINSLNVQVKVLLHTHAHFDHIGQADAIRDQLKTPIYLHKDDLFLYKALREQAAFFGASVASPHEIDHYIEDEEEFSLSVKDEDWNDKRLHRVVQAIFTPGHTPGSCSFYTEAFPSPMLFSGDTLFANSIGRTDLPGGDFRKIMNSIKNRVLTLPDETQVIPGHGPVTFLHQERRHNPFLQNF